jgi:hypothetical protein
MAWITGSSMLIRVLIQEDPSSSEVLGFFLCYGGGFARPSLRQTPDEPTATASITARTIIP